METISNSPYTVLNIIYNIIKDDSFPLKCKLHPRDLILRSMQDWSEIELALKALESEGLVTLKRADSFEISITASGLEKCRTASS